jgi:hypothetical protein
MKKSSLIPSLKGKVLNVLHLPRHLCWQSLVSWHHSTLMAWLCDIIDTDFIWALHSSMRCAIPITTDLFCIMDGPRHLWRNCMISPKQTLLCGLRPVVLQPWKKLARFHVQMEKFTRFYIYHDICISSSPSHSHHGSLMAWLCNVIDTDFI